jgi:hypothetical protein
VLEDARRAEDTSLHIIELNQPRFWLPNVSATFHGRDIFAPTAAYLINGTPFAKIGHTISNLIVAEHATPRYVTEGLLQGHIVHIDRFGNCITDIRQEHLRDQNLGQRLLVDLTDQQLPGLFRTYSDAPTGTPICLIGSSGHLEVAIYNGNAARYLGVDIGDKVRVHRRDDSGT